MASNVFSSKHLALFSSDCLVASFALIAYGCCCSFQLLNLCASVSGASAASSNCTSSSMMCANLGNISYPFWGSAACAASRSYVLSNCTSTEAYWDSFSSAADSVVGPPAISAVNATDPSIQLSWNTSLSELGYCAPLFSSKNLSLYNIPSSINLTSFDSDAFTLEFSPKNTFLLFNCTQDYNKSSEIVAELGSQSFVTESASGCLPYKGLCANLAKTPCIQWLPSPAMKALMLQQVLDSLACTHFMLGVADRNELGLIEGWSTGSMEFMWRDLQCKKCKQAGGVCYMDTIFPTKFGLCQCLHNMEIDLDTETSCSSIMGCEGGPLHCNTGAKVGVLLAAAVVGMLGIFLALRYKCDLFKLCRMIVEKIGLAFIWFTRVTYAIAINVLKGALRKLQLSSYGPKSSFHDMDFDGLTERPMEYSYGTLSSATKSFTTLVGEGGFSSVYKGTLPLASSSEDSDLQIAVKVLDIKSKHSNQQLLNEVITIGRIHHVNVVRLLGFCMRADYEILVYEYVENGSLDKWLFANRENASMDKVLGWGKRYTVAIEVARGLSYLHEECRHRTVHCDIKPQNILLDADMHPKIADFGLARLMGRNESKVMTFAKGTPGYMAPEFWMGGESELSTKFDVYSYGMVLLELISGRRNFKHDSMLNMSSSFPSLAYKAAMGEDLQSILDPRLSINGVDGDEAVRWDQVKTAIFVALWCIQDHPESRPQMSEVVKYLEGGAVVSEYPPQPNIATFYGSSRTPLKRYSSYPYETETTAQT